MNPPKEQPLPPAPFNAWAVLDLLSQRWLCLAVGTAIFALAGAGLAFVVWGRSFTSMAELVHYEPSTIDDTYHPRALVTPSLVVMLQSPGLLAEVGSHLQPPVSAKELAREVQITLDRNNDVATVTASASTRERSIDLVNRYCAAAVAYTQTMQRLEATEAGDNVNRQLGLVEDEIAATRAAIPPDHIATVNAAATGPDSTLASDLPQRIQTARDQLDDLLVRYTEAHPLVREQRARLAALEEAQLRAIAANPQGISRPSAPPVIAQALYGRITPEEIAMGERLRSLESNRAILIARQHAIQPFRDSPPGYFRVLSSVTENPTFQSNHRLEVLMCACLGGLFGLIGSAGLILFREFLDNHIKTRADVRRVTGLPLLATLGDLQRLPAADQDQCAFRAWTALQSRLRTSPNRGMICGVTSARGGDGRSTWVELLARAAVHSGFRVLTITTWSSFARTPELAPHPSSAKTEAVTPTTGALSAPRQIADQLTDAECPSLINLPLSGRAWNWERRKQWETALEMWSAIKHVVIFVELPPASVTETVLLAENIPNLLWVVDGRSSDAAETRADLENLRSAGCHLIGTVLNRERMAPMQERYSRWVATAAVLLFAGLGWPTQKVSAAEPTEASSTVTPAGFSVVDPAQRAEWQRRLTLGPGDVLRFELYGSPNLTRADVPIDPDGRVSYLEADNIVASGLTVDELRDRVNDELGKFRRTPQVFVTPVTYHSMRYYVLGSVMQRGVYPLDRPITIIEAVARAHGFETSVSRGNVIESTDFAHSFLVRAGHHLPVDFEKLFVHGDLSQNVALEPDDYLYFPAAAAGAVYVLGEVRSPGPISYDSDTNVIAVIAGRGGFTERAWKQRVLVVRNSGDQPEAFRVNAYGALEGKGTNLALQPGDVIYVSNRPWARAEELLDRAASAFIESAVITWTSIHVGAGVPAGETTLTATP
jgi:protein involved in polysaccharide export with SLBB domain/capsular polysaccharide biosynthesis protein/Mrp family chromosome partitioning ATPase